MNVQVIATINGDPLWTSPGFPGSVHDTRAAREHVMDELAPFVSRHTRTDGTHSLTVLADKGSPPRCAREVPPPAWTSAC